MKKFEHKNKDEKRRVLLSKNNELSYTFDNDKLPEESDAVAKFKNVNKRILAIVLAIVFLLCAVPSAVFLTLRGHASENDGDLGSVTLQVRANGNVLPNTVTIAPGIIKENVKSVTIDGLPDGAEYVKAILIDNDDVETEIKSIANYNGVMYYSLNDDTDFGTKVNSGEEVYLVYSTKYWITTVGDNNGEYSWNAIEEGNKHYIWSEDDLEIKMIQPHEYYAIDSITYHSGTSTDTLAIENDAVTIPASDIKGDITISFPFTRVAGYDINDVSYKKGLGNGGTAETRGKSTLTSSEYSSYFRTRYAPTSAQWDSNAGENGQYTKTFYLYSNSSSGGSNFQLNMLRINGHEMEVSSIDKENGIQETLSDGTVINVKLVATKTGSTQYGMYWLDNKPNSIIHQRDYDWTRSGNNYVAASSANKNRTIYEVTATNIHSDLDVEYNFKQKNSRELIIKGLNGITETAHAREKLGNMAYEYFFESSSNNIYAAYYNQILNIPSANLYLYRVKPGYNPYTVTSKLYYVDDNNNVTVVNNGILSGGGVGYPEEAIHNATAGIAENGESTYNKFDNNYRKWGGYTAQQNRQHIANDTNYYDGTDSSGSLFKGNPFILTEIGEEYASDENAAEWYGIALSQNAAKNQQLYLNASPYQFKIECDLAGGVLSDNRYNNEGNLLREKASHSVEDPKTYLPEEEPDNDNSNLIFEGWQLQKLDREGIYVPVDEDADLYQKADQFIIDGNTLSLINGDAKVDNQTIRFKAIWKEVEESSKTTIAVNIYKEVVSGSYDVERGGKKYKLIHESEETQLADTDVVLLNHYKPSPADYYEMRSGKYEDGGVEYKYKKLSTHCIKQPSSEIPETNQLRIYYDLKVVNLSVKKVVKGKPKSSEFNITVTLFPEENSESPLEYEQAKNLIVISDNGTFTEEDNTLVYKKTFKKGDQLDFAKIPYGWSYKVEEDGPVVGGKITEDDFTTEITPKPSGRLTKDTEITVTNKGRNPGIETEKILTKTDNDNDYYRLDLNAWATADSLTEMIEDTTALDIAIVVDQSGSMNNQDIGYIYEPVEESGKIKKKWTVAEAYNKGYYAYDEDDGEYHPVTGKAGQWYRPYSNTSFDIDDYFKYNPTQDFTFGFFGTSCRYGYPSDCYVKDANGAIHRVYFNTKAVSAGGAVSTGQGWTFYVTLYYFPNSKEGSVPGVKEDASFRLSDGASYMTAFSEAKANGTVKLLGADQEEAFGWGYLGISTMPKTYTGTLYEAVDGYNGLQYTNAAGRVVQLGTDATYSSDIVYRGQLYRSREVTRIEALKTSLKEFLETVKDNAEAQGVEHRVSLIGFAGNQVPGYSTRNGVYNYSQNSINKSYDYVNTGLFVDGTFKSYNEITNTVRLEEGDTTYINTHYFVNYQGTGLRPVVYENGKWYIVPDSTHTPSYHSVSVTQITSGEDDYSNNEYWFYDVDYSPLNDNNGVNYYTRALQTVNDDGDVNSNLISEVNMIGAYGGTYTSFGMAMATQVFHYNPIPEGENRKRIVIVFSDGSPGATQSSFDNAVASEAKADSGLLKNDYDAEVFTVYLYGQAEGKKQNAATFMEELSSNYDYEVDPAYDLDTSKSYVYKEGDKFTSVSASLVNYVKTGSHSWAIYENGDTLFDTAIGDDYQEGGVWGIGATTYFNRTKYYYGYFDKTTKEYVSPANMQIGEQYYYGYWSVVEKVKKSDNSYTTISTDKAYHAFSSGGAPVEILVTHDYLWYDSAGYITVPKSSEEDEDNKQFYLVASSQKETDESYYYQETNDANKLVESFEKITESLDLPNTIITLDGSNSVMRDIVTADFELPKKANGDIDCSMFSIWSIGAESIDANGIITWSDEDVEEIPVTNDNLIITENGDGTKTIDVKGFDYGEYYTADGHMGRKLKVTINNLTPTEGTIGTVQSNTDKSGIYWTEEETPIMVAEFDVPEATVEALNAYFKLNYGGFGKVNGLKFPVTFKLTKSDGETPYSGKFGDYTFSSDGTLQTMMGDGESKFFAEIPKKAKLTVTVSDPDNATIYFTYEIKELDDDEENVEPGEKEIEVSITSANCVGGQTGESALSEELIDVTREIQMDIRDIRQKVSITNRTEGSFADYGKEFPIDVLVEDSEGHGFDGTLLDLNGHEVEFQNGKPKTNDVLLSNNQTKGFYVPSGYNLTAKDKENPTPYHTDFASPAPEDGDVTIDRSSNDSWKYFATAVMDEKDGSITIIHIIDDIVPTGVSMEDHHYNPFIVGAIAVAVAGGAWLANLAKKRKEGALR